MKKYPFPVLVAAIEFAIEFNQDEGDEEIQAPSYMEQRTFNALRKWYWENDLNLDTLLILNHNFVEDYLLTSYSH